MKKAYAAERIEMVINTLNAAMIRADQTDAINRMNACVDELNTIAEGLKENEAENEPEQNV